MKVIQVHNYYQQAGGEDTVVKFELELLLSGGHEVITYYKHNDSLVGLRRLIRVAVQTLWNVTTYREFRELLKEEQPDVVHCHNTFPIISPSIYWACAKESVPVVQTLHNYRLLCSNALLFRSDVTSRDSPNGAICELCVAKTFKWPGVRYACYRDSKIASFVVATMLFAHKLLGTWSTKIDAYIALTRFQKRKMIEGGLPEGRIWVKPNSVETSDSATASRSVESPALGSAPYALFVGRLSPEKGCHLLIQSWGRCWTWRGSDRQLERLYARPTETSESPRLLIVGDGPERARLERLAAESCIFGSVLFLGKQSNERVADLMERALFLVVPSVWYEGFPMTIVEAFSRGAPVIAPSDGGMGEIVVHDETGLHFEMSNAEDLAAKIEWAFCHPGRMKTMGLNARTSFAERYSARNDLKLLEEIYSTVGR